LSAHIQELNEAKLNRDDLIMVNWLDNYNNTFNKHMMSIGSTYANCQWTVHGGLIYLGTVIPLLNKEKQGMPMMDKLRYQDVLEELSLIDFTSCYITDCLVWKFDVRC